MKKQNARACQQVEILKYVCLIGMILSITILAFLGAETVQASETIQNPLQVTVAKKANSYKLYITIKNTTTETLQIERIWVAIYDDKGMNRGYGETYLNGSKIADSHATSEYPLADRDVLTIAAGETMELITDRLYAGNFVDELWDDLFNSDTTKVIVGFYPILGYYPSQYTPIGSWSSYTKGFYEKAIGETEKPSITIASANISKTLGDRTFSIGASTNRGTLAYSSTNEKVAAVDANTGMVTLKGAGEADIIVSISGTDYTKKVHLTVAMESISISIKKSTISKVYGNRPFLLGASATKGKAVTYTSSNPKIATVGKNTGKVTIKGCGTVKITVKSEKTAQYKAAANKVITLRIAPKKAALISLSSTKKNLTIKWKKNEKVTGYEIAYSTKKGAKNPKTVTVKSASKIKKTISKLKSGKIYYVKVRAYTTAGGKKICGAYSAVKKLKVK